MTMIAADFIATAGLDGLSACQNLDSSAAAISDRGAGLRDPQLTALATEFANAAIRSGVRYGADSAVVCHRG